MEKKNQGEYLAPEVKVYEVRIEQVIATSGTIETSSEKDEIDW